MSIEQSAATSPSTSPLNYEEQGQPRTLQGWPIEAIGLIALCFSTYQLIVAGFHPLSSQVIRSLHVGFLVTLAFLVYPVVTNGKAQHRIPWYDWLLAGTGFLLGFYHWIFEADLIQRAGNPTTLDLVVGCAFIGLVFETSRRIMGWALPLICAGFLAYGLWGEYLPSVLAHRGYGFDQIVDVLFFGTEGIFGIPILVSATYIFLFILFGTFLEHAGMIRLFNAVALGLIGHAQGGPAKVAIVSSGLMGTISGSGIANVLTVGQFTIPLMKRYGYSPVFAGAVEATASMGGQIMPPVMGAVAFIMAETLNVPYSEIVKAAIIPALLYYFTAFWMVHLEAGHKGLLGIPKDQCPNPWRALRESWYLVLPLAVLVIMLFHGFTPMFSGVVGLALTVILILGAALAARISVQAFRYVFWVGIGLLVAFFLKNDHISLIILLIAALISACFFIHHGYKTLAILKNSLIEGAKQTLPAGLACAIVGVIIGVLSLTGAASTFAAWIMQVGEHSLFLSLVLTMIICIVLGTAIPTIPSYIITAAIAAPALAKVGVPLIIAHMFTFYFGIMADLTPPVALAALAASSIAKASPDKIGWKATQIAIAGFVIPYLAVYEPSLMLQGDWTIFSVTSAVFKAVLSIMLWAAASIGYWRSPLRLWERVIAVVAAAFLVAYLPYSDPLGYTLAGLLIVRHWLQYKPAR